MITTEIKKVYNNEVELTKIYHGTNQIYPPIFDKKIYVGGEFTSFNGFNQKGLVRLNYDGSVDTSYIHSYTDLTYFHIDQLKYNPNNNRIYMLYRASSTHYLSKLGYFTKTTPDTFIGVHSGDPSQQIHHWEINNDNSIDICGYGYNNYKKYTTSTEYDANGFWRVDQDGNFIKSLGDRYNREYLLFGLIPSINNYIYQHTTGTYIVNGYNKYDITSYNPVDFIVDNNSNIYVSSADQGLKKFNTNGQVVSTLSSHNYSKFFHNKENNDMYFTGGYNLLRLNSSGSFSSGSANNNIVSITFDNVNNKIYLGGRFTSYKGVTANGLIRLNFDGTVDTSFNVGTGANNNKIMTILYL